MGGQLGKLSAEGWGGMGGELGDLRMEVRMVSLCGSGSGLDARLGMAASRFASFPCCCFGLAYS